MNSKVLLLKTYDKLGVPIQERAALAGVAVDAVKPEITDVSAESAEWTNQNVVISGTVSDDNVGVEKVYIKNFDAFFENTYEVIEFYKACNEFKCSYDDEYGEICSIGADIVMFDMPDNKKVELTIDDLCNGYKLGLSTINEIGLFLLEHKTFDLSDLFHLGLESPK